jgi:hypothetical protein
MSEEQLSTLLAKLKDDAGSARSSKVLQTLMQRWRLPRVLGLM